MAVNHEVVGSNPTRDVYHNNSFKLKYINQDMINPFDSIPLSSLAAIEIELYLRKRKSGSNEYSKKLAQEIDRKMRDNFIFSRDFFIMESLLWPNYEDLQGKTTGDLEVQVNLFTKELRYFEELNREKQEELLGMCLRLSRLELASQDSRHYLLTP